jgi:hypothetical protein
VRRINRTGDAKQQTDDAYEDGNFPEAYHGQTSLHDHPPASCLADLQSSRLA